jgi:hypothetical protein
VADLSVPRLGLAKRSTSRRAAGEALEALGRFSRQEQWNGLRAGDVVRVAGHSARGRHWRFRAYVTNTSNGASWVEVSLVEGPPPSRWPAPGASPEPEVVRVERVRSFPAELVTARWRRRAGVGGRRRQWAAGQQSLF